jgi:hypothetical protein
MRWWRTRLCFLVRIKLDFDALNKSFACKSMSSNCSSTGTSSRLQSNGFWNRRMSLSVLSRFENLSKNCLFKSRIIFFGKSKLTSSAIEAQNSLKQWKWEKSLFPVVLQTMTAFSEILWWFCRDHRRGYPFPEVSSSVHSCGKLCRANRKTTLTAR